MYSHCPRYMTVLLMKFFSWERAKLSHASFIKQIESCVDTLSSNLYSLHSIKWTVKNFLTWHQKPLFPHSLAASQRLHLETKIPVLHWVNPVYAGTPHGCLLDLTFFVILSFTSLVLRLYCWKVWKVICALLFSHKTFFKQCGLCDIPIKFFFWGGE